MSIMRKKLLLIKHHRVAWSCSGNLCSIFILTASLVQGGSARNRTWSPGLLLYLYRTLEFGSGLFNWTQDLAVMNFAHLCLYVINYCIFIMWGLKAFEFLISQLVFLRCYNFFTLQGWRRVIKFTIQFFIWAELAREATLSEGKVQSKVMKVYIQIYFAILIWKNCWYLFRSCNG